MPDAASIAAVFSKDAPPSYTARVAEKTKTRKERWRNEIALLSGIPAANAITKRKLAAPECTQVLSQNGNRIHLPPIRSSRVLQVTQAYTLPPPVNKRWDLNAHVPEHMCT